MARDPEHAMVACADAFVAVATERPAAYKDELE
jgi:hypothetical protein